MNLSLINVAYASSRVDTFLANVNKEIVNPLIILLFSVALVYFLYGMFEFIANQTNEEAQTKGKSHMLWGVIGMTIMMGVFTIMNVIMNTFNITGIDPEKGTVTLPPYNP